MWYNRRRNMSLRINYEKELNPQQLEVVLNGDGPVLVLAGAGSGKTRTITYRVAYLLENGVLPQEILLLTFTNKAAREMLFRVSTLIQTPNSNFQLPFSGTFHSVANRLLRLFANEIGYSQNFTILDQEDTHSLIKTCLKEMQVDTSERRFPSPPNAGSLLSYARNSCLPIRSVLEERQANFFSLYSVFERLAEVYAQHKHESDAMDFDDLLFNLQILLEDHPEIRNRLSRQFRYVLVDEYQDTNVVQANIVRLLCAVHKNVLVVGDDAQSIYSFRAAQIRNILDFSKMYPGAKTFRLTTNYRSTPEILNIANHSIENNLDQFKKDLRAICPSLEKPHLAALADGFKEAQYITKEVFSMMKQGVPLKEIAVLFRAAFHSQALEFELMKQKIPYEYRGGLRFFERAHVKDVIAYLRLRANPKDEAAWLRVLGHQPGIGLVTAQKIISFVRSIKDISEVCSMDFALPKRAYSSWNELIKILFELSQQSHPADLIRLVISGDYRSYLEAEYPDFKDRLEDVGQFALFAEGTSDLTKFLSELSLTDAYGIERDGKERDDRERMVLSTIHQAKGLEWDAVFVIQVADGKFPNPRALIEDGGLEEERRLFYVATTRARKRLYYTYPLTSGTEAVFIQQPSLFLQELPKKLFEQVQHKKNEWEEPTIVCDELGERKSFLRSVDEL